MGRFLVSSSPAQPHLLCQSIAVMVLGMIRPTSRAALRTARTSFVPLRSVGTRFVSTQPPHLRSRSWKSSASRWGIAIAGIYYYNTSPVFAEQPHHNLLNPNVETVDEDAETSALDALIARRSKDAQENHEALAADASARIGEEVAPADGQGAAELAEEAQGEGAFNPETGEINWDCPCLGGMAHGPCGPQFREAFSCFVFSQEEPKGMDCIEKFQGMRDCFQEHPEVYKDELMDDEELDAELEAEKQELVSQIAERRKAEEAAATSSHRLLEEPAPAPKRTHESRSSSASEAHPKPADSGSHTPRTQPQSQASTSAGSDPSGEPSHEQVTERGPSKTIKRPTPSPVSQEGIPESDELIPKAAHDARASNGDHSKSE